MFVPVVMTRMKERNYFLTDRIVCVGFVVFDVVAALTGEREIVASASAILYFGDDVFEGMLLGGM